MNEKYLQVAKTAARKSGDLIRKRFYEERLVLEKNNTGLHLQDDVDSENIIKKEIWDNFSEHDILAEESGQEDRADNYLWIIDPIDGTDNYYCYNPFFCISIALARANELLVGVVYNPITNEMFWAQKGGGLYLNDSPNKKIKKPTITKSIFGGYTSQDRCSYLSNFGPDFKNHQNKLEMASAALELAYVAAGRINSYILDHGRIWDIAAGILLVKEAGGRVTDWQGNDWKYGGKEVLASNDERIHEEIFRKMTNIRQQ